MRLAFLLALLILSSHSAFAIDFDDDEVEAAIGSNSSKGRSQAKLKLYNGGRDDEELRVQATLPTPTRSIDGQSGIELPTANSHSGPDL